MVHDSLRSKNEQAYEPKVLSIEPYHHGKGKLKTMETEKLRYLQELLHRRGEKNADRYVIALTELKDLARRCYSEEISANEDDFVEMMCLDGCFIIEFLRKLFMPHLRSKDDAIFRMDWLFTSMLRDLILFENQVPFFVLVQLFDMTKFPDQEENLIHLALPLCGRLIPGYGSTVTYDRICAYEVMHLLDLVHKGYCSSFAATFDEINAPADNLSLQFIKSATELGQSGIKFEEAEQYESWLHISFENGKLYIPSLIVYDDTESIFRNLIAYEQYKRDDVRRRYVSDYTTFLDLLINTPLDVGELRHRKIIRNWLGDDDAVSTMFNKLGDGVMINSLMFCYRRVFAEVNEYSSSRRNIWRAHLNRNYFNTPWSIISFLAAVVLLVLTFLQTIFSILQYIKQQQKPDISVCLDPYLPQRLNVIHVKSDFLVNNSACMFILLVQLTHLVGVRLDYFCCYCWFILLTQLTPLSGTRLDY